MILYCFYPKATVVFYLFFRNKSKKRAEHILIDIVSVLLNAMILLEKKIHRSCQQSANVSGDDLTTKRLRRKDRKKEKLSP